MKYYLVFCYNHSRFNLLSRLIRWADGGDSSHCEIMVKWPDQTISYFGAVWPFSRMATEEEFLKSYTVVSMQAINVTDARSALWYLVGLTARPYSMVQILASSIKVVARALFKKAFHAKINAGKNLVCTEFCALFMRDQAGAKVGDRLDLLTITELKEIANYERFRTN